MAIFFSEGEQNNRGSPDCQPHKQKMGNFQLNLSDVPSGQRSLEAPRGWEMENCGRHWCCHWHWWWRWPRALTMFVSRAGNFDMASTNADRQQPRPLL